MSVEMSKNPARRPGVASSPQGLPARSSSAGSSQVLPLVLSWTLVGLPLAWGVWQTLQKALTLFQ